MEEMTRRDRRDMTEITQEWHSVKRENIQLLFTFFFLKKKKQESNSSNSQQL